LGECVLSLRKRYVHKTDVWIEIRDPDTHRLICRYDPTRRLLEHKKSKHRTIVDLRQYEGDEDDDDNGS
jgi:hypothetical protein